MVGGAYLVQGGQGKLVWQNDIETDLKDTNTSATQKVEQECSQWREKPE